MTGVLSSDPLGEVDLSYYRSLKSQLERWALMSESELSLEVLSRLTTSGTMSFFELRRHIEDDQCPELDSEWAQQLARVAALLPGGEFRYKFAAGLLTGVLEKYPVADQSPQSVKLLAELRFLLGDISGARKLSDRPDLNTLYHGYLAADVRNPFVIQGADYSEWIRLFNKPFTDFGLAPISLDDTGNIPFNRLSARVEQPVADGPLVSVIQTVYNPTESDLWAAARSILNQTWRNLELVLIDDHSPDMPPGLMEAIARSDSRVRIHRMSENQGTYKARNVGLRIANGDYITGQDSDDWSHPQRLERQMESVLANPHSAGVVTRANRTDDNLLRLALGHAPDRKCEVSFLFRREDALAIGGYLPTRKAADSEFRNRMERWKGQESVSLAEPLYMIRMASGSLSRADFRPGWSHQTRRAFWSAYSHWHEHAKHDELNINAIHGSGRLPFEGPPRIVGTEGPKRVEICVLGDWRTASSQMVDELAVLARKYDVGILHVDSPTSSTLDWRRTRPEVQKLVSSGAVKRIYLDDDTAVDTLLVREPSALQLGAQNLATIKPKRVLIVHEADAKQAAFDRKIAEANAVELFGPHVRWCIAEGTGYQQVEPLEAENVLAEEFPLIVNVDAYRGVRKPLLPGRLVIGRGAENFEDEWPLAENLELVYPKQNSIEVRVLGDFRGGQRVMGWREPPSNWVQFRQGQIEPSVFWRSVDCVVHFDNDSLEGKRRDFLEAMAAGAVIITSAKHARSFGDAVIESTPEEALDIAYRLAQKPKALNERGLRGRQYVLNEHSPERLIKYLQAFRQNGSVEK